MKYIVDTPEDLVISFTNYLEKSLDSLKANRKADNIICLNFLICRLRTIFKLTFKEIAVLLDTSEGKVYTKYMAQKEEILSKYWQAIFDQFDSLTEITVFKEPIKLPYTFADKSPEDLIKYLQYEFDIADNILTDKNIRNSKELSSLMFVASWLLRYHFRLSLQDISVKLQYPNHTSALYNLKQFANIYSTDRTYREKVNNCIKEIDVQLINYVNCPPLKVEKTITTVTYRFKCLEDNIKFTSAKKVADHYNLSEWEIAKAFKIDKKVVFKNIDKTLEKVNEKVRF